MVKIISATYSHDSIFLIQKASVLEIVMHLKLTGVTVLLEYLHPVHSYACTVSILHPHKFYTTLELVSRGQTAFSFCIWVGKKRVW